MILWTARVVGEAAPPSVPDAVFGPSTAFETFHSAQKVTVARLHRKPLDTLYKDPAIPKLDENDPTWVSHVLPFYRVETDAPVGSADASTLKTALSDPHSYGWKNQQGIIKACLPDYAVMFTFHGSPQPVHILLCFHCDQMAVLVGGGSDPLRVNSEEDFDLMRRQLLTIVKRLFPKDPDLQSLPLERKT